MVNLCTATDGTKGQSVDFLVCFKGISGKLNSDVAQYARVVSIVIAAMLRAGTTFNLHLLLVILGFSTEDDTTPVARFTVSNSLFRGEDDRCRGAALGNQFTATLADERSLSLFVTLDDGTRFNSQFSSIGDIDPSLKQVGALFHCLFAFEDKLCIAIANLCTIYFFAVISLIEENVVAGLYAVVITPGVFLLCRRIRLGGRLVGVLYRVVITTAC